jgi:hypothetical protein
MKMVIIVKIHPPAVHHVVKLAVVVQAVIVATVVIVAVQIAAL